MYVELSIKITLVAAFYTKIIYNRNLTFVYIFSNIIKFEEFLRF